MVGWHRPGGRLTGEGGREARALTIEAFRSLVTELFSRIVEAQGSRPHVSMPAVATAFVGAGLFTLEALVLDELEGEVEERIVGLLLSQIHGIGWALGLEPGTVQYVGPPLRSSSGNDASLA